MSCNCGGCVTRGRICIARGDDTSVTFNVYDTNGDEYDISGADEIVFIVAVGVIIGGNMTAGGAVLIEKRKSGGDIVIAGTGYQFVVSIGADDTADFTATTNYYEAQVTTSTGLKKTVAAGVFASENTMIKDIA